MKSPRAHSRSVTFCLTFAHRQVTGSRSGCECGHRMGNGSFRTWRALGDARRAFPRSSTCPTSGITRASSSVSIVSRAKGSSSWGTSPNVNPESLGFLRENPAGAHRLALHRPDAVRSARSVSGAGRGGVAPRRSPTRAQPASPPLLVLGARATGFTHGQYAPVRVEESPASAEFSRCPLIDFVSFGSSS